VIVVTASIGTFDKLAWLSRFHAARGHRAVRAQGEICRWGL